LRISGSVSLGHDPQGERREDRKALTIKAIAELYIEKHAKPKKRTWEGEEKQLKRDVIPHIGNMTKVTRQDIAKLIDRVADRGSPVASNRLLACVRCMFNCAIREGLIEDNPACMISKARR
jgi:site-specific recombinase XerD